MDIGVERLIADLQAVGFTVEGPVESGKRKWAIVKKYLITAGPFRGRVVDLAIPAPPDYPATPPGGIYISPQIARLGHLNVHDRSNETKDLPGEWQYWSRPAAKWDASKGGKCLQAHWVAIFSNYTE
ncbi:MAG TPA: E2/UBC family protein [Tepidisphaeraceae bacterium]|jgi:hypothetical protein